VRRTVALVLVAIGLGCGGRVSLEEVPADPIAYVRQSADSISGLDEFVRAVDLEILAPEEGRPQKPLRASLSLLTVPEGKISAVPDAGDGAYPLDWSPDGLKLLIGREQRRGGLELFEWNRFTGAWDRVGSSLSLGSASLGGGPIRLARVGSATLGQRGAGAMQTGVWLDVDREGLKALPGGANGKDPDVSPDGRHVVFTRPHPRGGREPSIFLGDLGGSEPRSIGRGSYPRFSRDGEWIVFVSRRRGSADIWMMRSNGSAKRPVVTSGFDEEYPALSPDGRFVVYASARDRGVSHLFMTRLDDRAEIQLTHTGQSGRPVW
jgi:dipeptidyl aminopeptidase/acylaminoacyl peptidase